MKRGIRQGCPLSPVLFALYIQPIAETLQQMVEQQGTYKKDTPNMLFYADDMVLWAKSQRQLQERLTTVVTTMEQLGLQICVKKTELQGNTAAAPETNDMQVSTPTGQRVFKYVKQTEAIRYLGSWSTVDMEEGEGITKL
jgi:hypothetical protein